ncbi:MAG: hypothetical protein WCW68_14470 [Methanothrix sp.]
MTICFQIKVTKKTGNEVVLLAETIEVLKPSGVKIQYKLISDARDCGKTSIKNLINHAIGYQWESFVCEPIKEA